MSARRWRRLAALVCNNEIPRVEVGACVEVSTEQFFLVLERRTGSASSSASASAAACDPIPLAVPGLTAVPWAVGAIEARNRSRPRSGSARDDRPRASNTALVRAARPRPAIDLTHWAWRARACPWPISSAGGMFSAGSRSRPARVRPARHHLGCRPPDRRPGQGKRVQPAKTGAALVSRWHWRTALRREPRRSSRDTRRPFRLPLLDHHPPA